MDPILPIAELLNPRLEAAPGDVVKVYLKTVAVLWHEAQRTGRPELPPQLLRDCAKLLEYDLAIEREGRVSIPWVTDAWERAAAAVAQRKAAADKRWKKPRKARVSRQQNDSCDRNAVAYAAGDAAHSLIHSLVPSDPSLASSSSQEGGVQRGKEPRPAEAGFVEFWDQYRVKKNRAAALKAWVKQGCAAFAPKVMETLAHMQAEDDSWQRGFQPHAASWLNAGGWDDVPQAAPPRAQAPPGRPMTADERQLANMREARRMLGLEDENGVEIVQPKLEVVR